MSTNRVTITVNDQTIVEVTAEPRMGPIFTGALAAAGRTIVPGTYEATVIDGQATDVFLTIEVTPDDSCHITSIQFDTFGSDN